MLCFALVFGVFFSKQVHKKQQQKTQPQNNTTHIANQLRASTIKDNN